MRLFIVSSLVLSAHLSFAQFTIKNIYSKDSVGRFIDVQSVQRAAAAKKINAVIQKEWGYDPNAANPFEGMSLTEEASFDFQTGANNDRVLSLLIESSYSACGLHITRTEYYFDSKTGNRIDIGKMFGPDGSAKLTKALNKSWMTALKVAATDTSDSRSSEYKDCLTNADKNGAINYHRMMIMDDGMRFWAGSCLEGTGYDFESDRGQGPHFYSLGKLLPMLTPYGYSLFVDKPNGPMQTLMRGMIDGKYPVSLTLLPAKAGSPEGTIRGLITYDRVGEPINMSGTMNGNQLMLHELDDSNSALSNIEVSWDGTKLTGSFINLKSKKQMPFVATVVK